MNAKQLFSVVALLTASGVAMAQTPAAEKPAAASQSAAAEASARMDKSQAQPAPQKAKSSAHDHKDDGPKKTIYSGA